MLNFFNKTGLTLVTLVFALLLAGSIATVPTYAQGGSDVGALEFDSSFDWDDDDFWTTTDDASSDVELEGLAAFGLVMGVWAIFLLPAYIYFALSLMTIAKKLNVANPWMAWVPIAQIVLFFQCAGLSPWLILLLFIPFANFIIMIYGYMKLAERRGFESWIGILVLVPVIGVAIPGYLAWGEPKAK